MVGAALHDERVAIPCAGRGDRGDGVADGDVPRQTGSLGDGGVGTGSVAVTIYCAVRFRSLSSTPRTACSVTDSGDITVSPTFTMSSIRSTMASTGSTSTMSRFARSSRLDSVPSR